jgi:predicted peptidase
VVEFPFLKVEVNMRLAIRRTLLSLLLALIAVPAVLGKKPETGFLDRTMTIGGTAYKYQVFVPENWTARQAWPVILFLHGAGERGDDGLMQTEVGIATAIRWDRSRFPAIVVIPQCRKSIWWAEEPMQTLAIHALEAATREFHGDPRRIYLTGLSMGGYGTWALASRYPGRFAAIAPICGGILMPDEARKQPAEDNSPYKNVATKIGPQTPVWIFHGAADDTVPPSESRRMNDAMKALGGEVHYTEYPGVGHNSWDKAYEDPELMKWLLSKSLATAPAKK